MARVLLIVLAAGWAIFGLISIAAPAAVLSGFGIQLTAPDALTEVRAMYGGAQVGMAAFLFWASRSPALARPALLVIALVMAGFAIGRTGGILVDGARAGVTLGSLGLEVLICAVALLAFRRESAAA